MDTFDRVWIALTVAGFLLLGIVSYCTFREPMTERERRQWQAECEERVADGWSDGYADCSTDMDCELLERRIQEECQL